MCQVGLLLFCATSVAAPQNAAPQNAAPQDGAPQTLQLNSQSQDIDPQYLALLRDPAGTLGIADVQAAWEKHQFSSGPTVNPNQGITDAAVWARLVIENPLRKPRQRVLTHDYAPTDQVTIYYQDAVGAWRVVYGGDTVSTGEAQNRVASFPIDWAPGQRITVFMRVQTESNLNFELSLWPPELYQRYERRVGLAYGLLLGAILATTLYLLFAAAMVRNLTALWLGLYLLSYGAYVSFLAGIQVYWLPRIVAPHVNVLHLVSMGLLFGFGALFFRRFLELREHNPRCDRIVAVLQWLGFLMVLNPLLPLPAIGLILFITAAVGPLFTTGLAMFLWYRRRPQAGIFALGWLVAHASSLLGALRVNAVLPNRELFIHLPAVGCACAISLFALGIALRLGRERRFAYEDALTGVANRRRFEEQLDIEMGRSERYGRPLSLIYLDVDHFKDVNDAHGHTRGDTILCAIAALCLQHSRTTDLVARIGGEEFAIVLMETGMNEAMAIAERLRQEQENAEEEGIKATISLGVTEMSGGDQRIGDIMDRADRALYMAKRNGRNRVEFLS